MEWYKVTLTVLEVGQGKALALQRDFMDLYMAVATTGQGIPKGIALFASKSNDPQQVYLTPACFPFALGLVAKYRAVPSPQPNADDISHFAGSTDAVSLYFGR